MRFDISVFLVSARLGECVCVVSLVVLPFALLSNLAPLSTNVDIDV